MSDSRYTYTATEEGQPLTEPDRGDRGCRRVTRRPNHVTSLSILFRAGLPWSGTWITFFSPLPTCRQAMKQTLGFVDSLVVKFAHFNNRNKVVIRCLFFTACSLVFRFQKKANWQCLMPSFLVSSPWHVLCSLSNPWEDSCCWAVMRCAWRGKPLSQGLPPAAPAARRAPGPAESVKALFFCLAKNSICFWILQTNKSCCYVITLKDEATESYVSFLLYGKMSPRA